MASEGYHWKKCSMTLIAVKALNNRPDKVPKTNAGQIAGLAVFKQILLQTKLNIKQVKTLGRVVIKTKTNCRISGRNCALPAMIMMHTQTTTTKIPTTRLTMYE